MLLLFVSGAYTTGCLNKNDKAIGRCGFQQCNWVGCLTRESEVQGAQRPGVMGILAFFFLLSAGKKMPENLEILLAKLLKF